MMHNISIYGGSTTMLAKFRVALATVWSIQALLLICLPSTLESEGSSAECILTLYDFGNLSQLVLTTSGSTFADESWNDTVSSIEVDGGCQWILYSGNFSVDDDGTSFVIGPGPATYLNGDFGIPDNSLLSVRCLPASGTMAIVLFEHHMYYGDMLVLSSSNANLGSVGFDNRTSSFIITGGTWQLYSEFGYQGESVMYGVGFYRNTSFLESVSNDNVSSVRVVGSPPQFVIRPNQTTAVDAGSAIGFTCVAYGVPNPSISWNKGDSLLSNGSQVTIYEELLTENGVTLVQSILLLCSAEREDAGQYSCFAENTFGNDTALFELTVAHELPPQFVIRPNQITTVDAGNAIGFTCVASGVPNPSISWNKGDTLLSNGSQVTISEELLTENGETLVQSILLLCSAEREDAGQYSCFTENTLGNDTALFELTVAHDTGCNLAAIDLVFVLDASGSIGSANFLRVLDLVRDTVTALGIGPDEGQVAVIRFSDTASVTFGLTAHDNEPNLLAAVNGIAYTGGGTNTAAALDLLVSDGFTGARPQSDGIPRFAVVVTDGLSNDQSATTEAATRLHAVIPEITIIAVGIGDFDLNELERIASIPNTTFVRTISGFNTAELEMLTQTLRQEACQASISPAIGNQIQRGIGQGLQAFFVYQLPEQGFTIQVTAEIGQIAVCGSTTIERPSCRNMSLHDWRREVTEFADIYITPDGLDADSLAGMVGSEGRVTSNIQMFVTLEGLGMNNSFVLNTTLADTRIPRGPQFVMSPNQTNAVNVGSAINFTCVASGVPNPSISWKKGDTLLMNDVRVKIQGGPVTENVVQSILRLSSAELADAGQYSCFAENTLGSHTASFELTVVQGPRFVIRPNTITVDTGSAINFTCVVSGVPSPSISWKKGITLLMNDTGVTIQEELMTENVVRSILKLSSAKQADDGQYSCFAVNTLGNDTASFELTVSPLTCPPETDTGFGIAWSRTVPGETSEQSCGANYTGNAARLCQNDTTWAPPDVSRCENVAFAMLRTTAEDLFANATADDETVAQALNFVSSLATVTEPTTVSIFPRELNTSNYIITNTVDLLLSNLDQGGSTDITASTEVVGVIDNLLNEVNLAGFQTLQAEAPASQSVLNNAERYVLYLATAVSQNGSEEGIRLSRGNIVIGIDVINGTQPRDVTFPQEGDLENFMISSDMSPPEIIIPSELIAERSNSRTVSVANILFRNLQDFLPQELNNSTATPASLVISSQVAGGSMESQTLQENPVTINFTVERAIRREYSCVFWNFSDPIGDGGWSTEGVTTNQVTQDGNNTVVQCSSTHLTSFAVLVNVAGTPVDTIALEIVTYIGLGISLTCLLLTIIFFLSLGKKLFKTVHNFVHLNLAIALFLAYLTFLGVELAVRNKAACQAVTAIMQYFILASFSWMLCEGIMLYLMLVLVFNRLSKKWWFFFLLGWIPPVIFVVIGLTTVLDEYVVYSRNATTGEVLTDHAGNNIISYCWLSSGFGTNAIWTFVAPMLAIVLINSVFLILVLVSVFRNRRNRMVAMKEEGKRVDLVVTLVKASLILLPLLGLTWVLGLFAVNQNTLWFAWLFTIFNSLQGMFIFFFHVLRSERIWGRIKEKYKVYSSSQSKPGDKGTASTSGGKKINGVTDTNGGAATLELKEGKTDASFAFDTQFEPTDDATMKPITDDEVAAVTILESTMDAERPAEEEVKEEIDPTSGQPTSETTTAADAECSSL